MGGGFSADRRKRFFSNCMRPLSKNIHIKKYVGFDVETYGKTNKFYSGGLYWFENGKEKFEYFTDKEKMAKFMLQRRFRNKYIVATNLNFDFTVVYFNTKYWNNFKIIMRNGSIIQASFKLSHNHGSIRFIDTANYAMFSVEQLGNIIGIPKFKKPSFLGKKPTNDMQRLELMNYNRQDCKISHDFMLFFQKGVNELKGSMKLTIASTTLHTWRMNYQPCVLIKEEYITNNDKIRAFIFEGYYGGRTEVFKRGFFEKVNYYDVNSLYPYVMKTYQFPLPQSVRMIRNDEVSLVNIMNFEGVSQCEVSYYGMDKPLLPLRIDDKLCFPMGTFSGTWNNCELRKAISLGYKVKPKKQIIYTKTFDPFSTFVDKFYETRQRYLEEKSPFEFVVKIMLNSLYGKFGMKKTEDFKIIDMTEFDNDHKKFFSLTKDAEFDIKKGKLILRKERPFNGIYSFPILASYVTSYARMHMYDYINKQDVIYTDTDSVVTLSEIEGCDRRLGNMKHEGEYKNCIFVKPKFYLIDTHVKIKGITRADVKDFYAILRGDAVKKQKFIRLKEAMRRNIAPNTIIDVEKSLILEDNKRVWEHNDLTKVSNSTALVVEM